MIFPIGSRWAQKLSCFDNSVWSEKTRGHAADEIRAVDGPCPEPPDLTKGEAIALMLMGYFQPVARAELGNFLGTPKATSEICSKM